MLAFCSLRQPSFPASRSSRLLLMGAIFTTEMVSWCLLGALRAGSRPSWRAWWVSTTDCSRPLKVERTLIVVWKIESGTFLYLQGYNPLGAHFDKLHSAPNLCLLVPTWGASLYSQCWSDMANNESHPFQPERSIPLCWPPVRMNSACGPQGPGKSAAVETYGSVFQNADDHISLTSGVLWNIPYQWLWILLLECGKLRNLTQIPQADNLPSGFSQYCSWR